MVVSYELAKQSSLDYFGKDEIAADVFLSKYVLRDEKGNLLEKTPRDMHKRIAKELARIEKNYVNPLSFDEIFCLLDSFAYLVPQGSPMSAIGNNKRIQSLSNCFVIDSPHDSYGGILHTDQEQAQIMKRRGGVGFDISTIRPKGMPTSNAAVTTDGLGVFMERFSNTCREVAQNGRRGALMLTIDVRHPEIQTFIDIKRDKKKVTGANISIRLTDDFMNAVKNDSDYTLQWPVESDSPEVTKIIRAKELWDQIIDAAWSMAEPGLLFWDTVRRMTPADVYEKHGFRSISTNPCGEIVLSAYDACRLLVINTLSYVLNPFSENPSFDFEKFFKHAKIAQRLMDDIIDLEIEQIDKIIKKIESDPEPNHIKLPELDMWKKIRDMNYKGRRTGLGITALGDMIASLNMRYGSPKSIEFTENVYKKLAVASHLSSVELAKERGSFPVCDPQLTRGHPFMERILAECTQEQVADYYMYGRRNICTTTTAPAGSVSVLTQTTSGIEPAFMVKYRRRKKINANDKETRVDFIDSLGDKWQEYDVYHHAFKKWMDVTGKTKIEDSPYYNATANDVDWVASVDIQAAAQKYVEHSISKTCNLPHDAPKELVAKVYMTAWEKGCKGFTVYRDGCRDGVLLTEKNEKKNESFKQYSAPKRPKELPCKIHHTTVRDKNWTIFVSLLEGKPYEVFGGLAKYIEIPKKQTDGVIIKHPRKSTNSIYDLRIGEGSDAYLIKNISEHFENPNHSHTTRLISLSLRHGANIQYVVEQLQKEKDADMFTFVKSISRVLKNYIADGSETTIEKTCPNCEGTKFVYQEGCATCSGCGYSKCG